jgi:hypothetical protein
MLRALSPELRRAATDAQRKEPAISEILAEALERSGDTEGARAERARR